ncbi:MAG: MFS transporter [Chloroflexota bacterium]|nr:MFS transporter [Chloroflexota bacterium]
MDHPSRRSVVFFCLGIALFWAALYIYVPILSVYAQSLGASLPLVGLIVASYGVVQLLLRIPLGVASDRLGRRKPFVLAGFLAVALSCVGLALSPTPELLALIRVGYGVGQGFVYPTLMGLSIRAVPQSERASAMGIFQAVYALGMFGGPAISGLIADHGGLRAMFLVTGGISLGMALLALWGLRMGEEDDGSGDL